MSRYDEATDYPVDSIYRGTGNWELRKEDRILLLAIAETL